MQELNIIIARGRNINCTFELYDSLSPEHRNQLKKCLENKASIQRVLQGSTKIATIKEEFEKAINQKIFMMIGNFVPNPLDCLGDIADTIQTQELRFKLLLQLVTG
ncbi:hypothetical protein pb186bvf_009508 [Paramecium bursaria]